MRLRCLLVGMVLLHLALGAGIGLSVDEAHYLLYAAHPGLSYFDHPPLVGWVQWPGVVLDAPVWLLRAVPGLAWLLTVALACRMAYRLAQSAEHAAVGGLAATTGGPSAPGERAAWWTALALALAPLMHILGMGLLPDSLLMLWAVALMAQTHRLMQPGAAGRTRAWLGLGLLLGLAGLSKYTAVFCAVAVAYALLAAHGLALLRNARLWLAAVLALVMVLPVLVWNAQHQWVSFAYQADHGAGGHWQAVHVLRFALVQVLAFGPLLWWAWAGWRRTPGDARWLLAFFVLPAGVLAAMAGGGTSLPHWTAPAWVCLAPFAGLGLAQRWAHAVRWQRGGLVATAVWQGATCVGLWGLMLGAGQPLLAPSVADVPTQPRYQPNPFADLHGWDAAGTQARTLAAQHQLGALAVQNWTLASRLGWYARPVPVHVLDKGFSQFSLWAGDLPVGADALLVDWSHMPFELPVGAHGFAQCDLLQTQDVQRWGQGIAQFRFYACRGWAGQPAPALKLVSAHD